MQRKSHGNNIYSKPVVLNTQRNGPLSVRGKSFCENPLDAKRISFGIKYIALEAKN